MSTPCCLVEPSITYKLGDLPKAYWKLYAAAGKIVEQIKQHIPRVSAPDSFRASTLGLNMKPTPLAGIVWV